MVRVGLILTVQAETGVASLAEIFGALGSVVGTGRDGRSNAAHLVLLLVTRVVVVVVYASQRHQNVVCCSSLSLVSLFTELAQEAVTLVAMGDGASIVGAQIAFDSLGGGSGE